MSDKTEQGLVTPWKNYKETILSKLGCQDIYGQIKKQKSGTDGWITGLCPFHNDSHNSFAFHTQTLKFCCFAGCGKGSALDFLMLTSSRGFKETLLELGDRLNIPKPQSKAKPRRPPIREELLKQWQANLNDELLRYLREQRGLSDETIKKYQLGWDVKRQRYVIPIRDERGNLVNIRLYNPKKDPKIINYTEGKHKYGSPARLYSVDELVKYQGNQVIICEGEFDRLLLQQDGFMVVTSTHGCSTFRPEWVSYFAGKDVVVIFDCDKEGQAAVNNIIFKAFKNSKINSIKNIALPLRGDKDDKDITDYFHKRGFTGTDLQKLIDETPPHKYQEDAPPEEIIQLKSFTEVEQKEYIDKKIQCEITVCGETSEAFHAVEEFKVTYCNKLKKGECFECAESIKIPIGAQEYIGSCMSTNVQLKAMLRDYCCKYGQKPAIEIIRRTTVKEFFCHQRVNRIAQANIKSEAPNNSSDGGKQELMEKKVYYVSSEDVTPGNYLATGYVKSHPKTQMVTFLIDSLIPQDDDFQAFSVEEKLSHLKAIQKLGLSGIMDEISEHITRVYERDELLLGVMLTYCSPRKMFYYGKELRGWLITLIIGDTGTAKTMACENIANFIGAGDFFSCLTGTRTGLVYALVEHPQKGWQVKIGRYPANSGKLLVVDETQELAEWELKTMGMAVDKGFIQIDRVATGGYDSETRLIMLANPKEQGHKRSDPTMDHFRFGCTTLLGVFPPMLIRRSDIAIFLSGSDLKNMSLIQRPPSKEQPSLTSQMLRALVYWIWNLKPSQIVFTTEAEKRCSDLGTELNEKFSATDLPILFTDSDKTVARIAAAFAGLSVSANDDFSQLLVLPTHVENAARYMRNIYSQDNCQLDLYAEFQRRQTCWNENEEAEKEVLEAIRNQKHDPEGGKIFFTILSTLVYLKESISLSRLAEDVGATKETVCRKMELFRRHNLVRSSSKGYFPTPKFNKFIRSMTRKYPDLLD
jgi:5S rRNA maturation endonuclease (ribonuclease M5)